MERGRPARNLDCFSASSCGRDARAPLKAGFQGHLLYLLIYLAILNNSEFPILDVDRLHALGMISFANGSSQGECFLKTAQLIWS